MVAAKKIDPGFYTPKLSTRLNSLLLDVNYKKNDSTIYNKAFVETNQSRIEAEYQMEAIFKRLF